MSGSSNLADIGLFGLGVMGENLVVNMESKGFTVAIFNRHTDKVDKFMETKGKGKKFIGCKDVKEFISKLKKPRRVMTMVPYSAVDEVMKTLQPFLEKGDILIDGGNSHYNDTNRRVKDMEEKGMMFIGTGVSGGEYGALHGPSIMPGGSEKAWEHVKDIFQSISAHLEDGTPCCDWVGKGGAGHYVKMVHNGIEYGDMELIGEIYYVMKYLLGMSNPEIHGVFKEWNSGELSSYLTEITVDILVKKDNENQDKYLVDQILDRAEQKGTGKWTAQSALDHGIPATILTEAVYQRCLSSFKDKRVKASKILEGPTPASSKFQVDKSKLVASMKDAFLASRIVGYAQGYWLLKEASKEYEWNLNFPGIASMWSGGCIIRSALLKHIMEAYRSEPDLDDILLNNWFAKQLQQCQQGWRETVVTCVMNGISCSAISSALSYYDNLRNARMPTNLTQAQRDYFGSHTYERVDKDRGKFKYHTDWMGQETTTLPQTK